MENQKSCGLTRQDSGFWIRDTRDGLERKAAATCVKKGRYEF